MDLPDATWKAVIWLESQEGHLDASELEKNRKAIKQLETCQTNLERQYEDLIKS